MEDGTWNMAPPFRPCSLSLVPGSFLSQLGQDVGFPEDEELLVLGAADVDGDALAVVIEPAGADGEHLAHLGLFASGVRNDEAGGADLLLPDLLYEDAVAQGDQPGGLGGRPGGLGGRLGDLGGRLCAHGG